MKLSSAVRVIMGIGVLFLLCGSAGEVRAGKPGGSGGGGSTTNIKTNMTVVDSHNKLVGEVLGTQFFYNTSLGNSAGLTVVLDPSLVNGASSVVVILTRSHIFGYLASTVYFDGLGCSGTAYNLDSFVYSDSLITPSYVTTNQSGITLYTLLSPVSYTHLTLPTKA